MRRLLAVTGEWFIRRRNHYFERRFFAFSHCLCLFPRLLYPLTREGAELDLHNQRKFRRPRRFLREEIPRTETGGARSEQDWIPSGEVSSCSAHNTERRAPPV